MDFKNRLRDVFFADLRSLAALRVGLGFLLVLDLLTRVTSLRTYYTDEGVFTRSNYFEAAASTTWSIHALNGSLEFQVVLFLVAFIFAVMLLIGYRTKLATLISLILLLSLQNRNLDIVGGADVLLRLMLFWGLFLPWHAVFSIDSVNNSAFKKLPRKIFSFGILGYFLQIAFLYFFAGILKSDSSWTTDLTAVYYALKLKELTTPIADIMLLYPSFLASMTFFVRSFEIVGPFLLFSPFLTPYIRLGTIGIFTFLHLSFGASMLIGLFPLVDIVALWGMLPTFFWDKLFFLASKRKNFNITIYFDSECGLCYKVVVYLKTFFLFPCAVVLPAKKDKKFFTLMKSRESWIVKDSGGKLYFKSRAVVPIIKASPILFIFLPLSFIPGIFSFGDRVYDFISKRRYNVCKISKKQQKINWLEFSSLSNFIAVFFIVYILLWNISGLKIGIKIPERFQYLGYVTGVNQQWLMFAPAPFRYTGWYIVSGVSNDGEMVNLRNPDKPLPLSEPKNIAGEYRDYRDRRFFTGLFYGYNSQKQRAFYADYLCREWNMKKNGTPKIESVSIDYIMKKTPPPGVEQNDLQKFHLTTYYCR